MWTSRASSYLVSVDGTTGGMQMAIEHYRTLHVNGKLIPKEYWIL